ncbi:hypothetical protein ANN_28097 [Periplaneta americana]|uniref:Tc1-like transposase DDE domain-containing protein n=1 Tax=Periplaneta americana TaxID=6978 RepID=A0ABQ8RV00_PERAM|nr:hypothetical protein ANN_28097 [Periplaneta americana]
MCAASYLYSVHREGVPQPPPPLRINTCFEGSTNMPQRRQLDPVLKGRINNRTDTDRSLSSPECGTKCHFQALATSLQLPQVLEFPGKLYTGGSGQAVSVPDDQQFVSSSLSTHKEPFIRRGIATNVRLFRGAVCPQFIFMDDNARPHRVNLVDEYHEGEYIRRMDWPAMSPDLNSIEHTWDALGRRVATHQPPSRTLSTLRNALHQEWKQLSAELLNHVIEGMPRRCDVCVALRGNYTPY